MTTSIAEAPRLNEKHLAGMICPECGADLRFTISATTEIDIVDDGVVSTTDLEYDSNSKCRCSHCSHVGIVADFMREEVIPFPREILGVVSTAHISYEDAQELTFQIDAGHVNGMSRDHGWLLSVNHQNELIEKELPSVANLLSVAQASGLEWLLLDCDGPTLEGLNSFVWENAK